MATSTNNTMREGLEKIAQQITSLKFTPDADLPLLIGLETTILQAIQDRSTPSAPPPPPGNAMEMAGAADMGMGAEMIGAGAAMGGMPGGGGGVPAGMPGPGGPMPPLPGPRFNPDVMRRAMRGGGVQGG